MISFWFVHTCGLGICRKGGFCAFALANVTKH